MSFRIPPEGMKNPLMFWLMAQDEKRHDQHRMRATHMLEIGAGPLSILAEYTKADNAYKRWQRAYALFQKDLPHE